METGNLSGIEVSLMKNAIIDAHIHLDMYEECERNQLLNELDMYKVEKVIAVSTDYQSALTNLEYSKQNKKIKPAAGFHPEQPLPEEAELQKLFSLIERKKNEIVAIGEVGLPYYLRKEQKQLSLNSYIEILEVFVKYAAKTGKPIALHAIYEDAEIVCDLLERYSVSNAHFHWFKGSEKILQRMKENGYFVSFTPDCLYEEEIKRIIKSYPIELMMAETDGPWPFAGPFSGELTHPKMIHSSIKQISRLKNVPMQDVYSRFFKNTSIFYDLQE
ncbi:TatD family hydrolase [Halobacillus salinarum]|uniref:TatD family hydrolase n=1 Tax=Halobacillus salinarum TaxID=2932257 RepID=A0ABY4EPD3_9BACI|nr:TatD family hydrolase [Halobacillus salinarum]UOQ43946.1 TatD family hydrolase [Halobacillus salinarum]